MPAWRALLLAPVALASVPCVKDSVLAKDALLPAPSSYVQTWTECQKKCQAAGLLCDSFSFKEDTLPSGGCWLFPQAAALTESEDPKAFTGPKSCPKAPVKPDAVPPSRVSDEGGTGAKAALRGYGIPAAAAHSYGVANAGHDVPGAVFEGGESGAKTLVATPSSGNASNLAVAGGFGAAAVAVGAFFMLGPTGKKKTKRGLKRQEEEVEEVAATARSVPLVEPPQVMYAPGYPTGAPMQVTYAPQMLQPMSAYQAGAGGEYMMVTEPVTAAAQYVYEQPETQMAYQPVAA